ncbi:apolipoprotein L2-like [Dipodomys merriami]|uniref:apolipoprotein L2-like n=1 Tax=Dipodomys merriami TaxID=94247 RepID=UPI0038557DF1
MCRFGEDSVTSKYNKTETRESAWVYVIATEEQLATHRTQPQTTGSPASPSGGESVPGHRPRREGKPLSDCSAGPMEPEFFEAFPENKDFFKFVIDNLQDPANWDYLQLLLTEDDAWEEFMAGAVLSRYEGVALRKALEQLAADAMEDTDRLCTELQDRKSFLDTFPQVKMELKEQIRKLRELADKADKVQRDCAISRVMASSTSAASGVLRILGLAVAPVTLGGVAALLVSGLGLEVVSTLTSAASSLVGGVRKWSVEAEATHLLSTSMDKGKTVKEVLTETTLKVAALGKKYFQDLPRLQKNIEAIRLAKANPRLAASARTLMTTGTISARSTKQVQKVFGGTILAMTKGARMMGAATAGVFLLMDVVNLVKESKRLFQGPKTESAEKLRQEALELEKKLEELTQIHERVLSDVSWMPSLEQQRGQERWAGGGVDK